MKYHQCILFPSGKAILGILLFLGCWHTAGFGQSLITDGALHTLLDSNRYREFLVPNSPDKPWLYLSAVGADGGKREFTVITTCTKEGGQGAHAAGWFKIGNDGLTPGGTLRFIIGQQGADQSAPDTEAAGGGGGTGVIYLPKGANQAIPQNWKILLVAGGGGGGASDGFCGGSHGQPGQAGPNGSNGDGPSHGAGGADGAGGDGGSSGAGGGGWRMPGKSTGNETYGEFDFWNNLTMVKGGGFSGSGKMVYSVQNLGIIHDFWSGGFGGNRNAWAHAEAWGGFGFGGGGSGLGSGGGGGYSGGGGGGLTGAGNGGGGGGGSYVNTGLTAPYTKVTLEQRGTTVHPASGTVQYQFFAESPVATRDLGFEYHKGTEVRVLQAGAFFLLWQSDGNLVLYGPGFDYGAWTSQTSYKSTDLYFQGDGNMVIYNNGNPVWASNTANDQHGGNGGRKLVLTNDGHLYIVDQNGNQIWTGR